MATKMEAGKTNNLLHKIKEASETLGIRRIQIRGTIPEIIPQ
jgi:hypothetical protein